MTAVFFSKDIACGGCTSSIEKLLATVGGVRSVSGDPQNQTVTVEFDEGELTREAIISRLEDLGFESSVVA